MGNFDPIREWLRLKIHQYGSVYAPKVLLDNSLNEGYNPDYFVTYLRLNIWIYTSQIELCADQVFIIFLRLHDWSRNTTQKRKSSNKFLPIGFEVTYFVIDRF